MNAPTGWTILAIAAALAWMGARDVPETATDAAAGLYTQRVAEARVHARELAILQVQDQFSRWRLRAPVFVELLEE